MRVYTYASAYRRPVHLVIVAETKHAAAQRVARKLESLGRPQPVELDDLIEMEVAVGGCRMLEAT